MEQQSFKDNIFVVAANYPSEKPNKHVPQEVHTTDNFIGTADQVTATAGVAEGHPTRRDCASDTY